MPNKLGWSHDGHTFNVASDDVVVLETPFATLAVAPSTMVGEDPVTGLPAYCPAAAVTTSVPIPAVVVPSGGTDPCGEAKCGAALALQAKLVSDYDNWRQWINAAIGFAVGGLIGSVLVELAAALAAADVAAWVLQVLGVVTPLIGTATVTTLPSLIPSLSGPQVDFVLQACYCPLVCAAGEIALTDAQKQATSAALLGNRTVWTSDLQRELMGEIAYYEPLQDWQAAMMGAAPSTVCSGITCP